MRIIFLAIISISAGLAAADAPIEIEQETVITWKCKDGGSFGVVCEKEGAPLPNLQKECVRHPAGCLALKVGEINSYCKEEIQFKCIASK